MKNGSTIINTYFVLNKKDRFGNSTKRPFHHVLEQLKKQDLEEAKLRQSSRLKNTQEQNSSIKENGFRHSNIPSTSKSNELTSFSSRMDMKNSEYEKTQYTQISLTKSANETVDNSKIPPFKSSPVPSNSKICQLL